MTTTPKLGLPYLAVNQSQKHVTHNEALRLLDGQVQLSVLNRTLTAPPNNPANGNRYLVATGATGAWAGWDLDVAFRIDGAWVRLVRRPGWRVWVEDEEVHLVWNGTAWQDVTDRPLQVPRIGVNTTADNTNRLAVASTATLLTHVGAGHQIKINKATAGDTASLLFQTGFSGRAEMGTAGSDSFEIKVSADGSAWFTALAADPASGRVTLPAPVLLGGQASDPPSPTNGMFWLNTTTGEVKVQSAGQSVVIAPSGGGGVTDGDKGDIIVSGGGTTWTIDSGAVTLGKMAALATSRILGRASSGSGSPEALTPAQVRTMLSVETTAELDARDVANRSRANHTGTQPASTITGLATVATSGAYSDLSGIPSTFPPSAHTHLASEISDSTAAGQAFLTASNAAAQTALLDVFSNTAKGLVPASGGGTSNFLRADGTWAAPASEPVLNQWDHWNENWFSNNSGSAYDLWGGTAIGSGTVVSADTNNLRQGFNPYGVALRSSSSAHSGYRYVTSASASDWFGVTSRKFRARIGMWDTIPNSGRVRVGFHDTTNHLDPTDGAYFQIFGATLSCRTASGGSITTHGTTLTLNTQEAYVLEIDVPENAASVQFRVWQGTNATPTLDVTIGTNIPVAVANAFGAGIVATASEGAVSTIVVVYSMGKGTIAGYERATGRS
jgi:hypothetical protein